VIVDCHVHWGSSFADARQWLAVLQRHGVTHAAVLPLEGLQHAARIPQDNDRVATLCASDTGAAGRLIGFCTINTWFRESLKELRRCLTQLQARGIKFHPWMQGQPVNSDVMDEVCQLAEAADVPVLFHDGTPPFSLPSQVGLLARRHPRVKMILGHSGLFEHWREAIVAMRHARNLWGCLCGPYVQALRQIITRSDTSRLVWGSDFGYTDADCVGYRLDALNRAAASDRIREEILVDNPSCLLRLK